MQAEVDVLIVYRAAEDCLTRAAADASGDVLLPDGGAVLVGIERPHQSLFGRGDDYGAAVRQGCQIRRGRVVPVRPGLLHAILRRVRRLIPAAATAGLRRIAATSTT